MQAIDKRALLERLRQRIDDRLRELVGSQRSIQTGATHEQSRAEHAKDTRATEASYLARGLARRVEELELERAALATLATRSLAPEARVGVASLVGLESDAGESQVVFVVPAGGGETLPSGDDQVRTLTPVSPLGRALLGREVDDEVEPGGPAGDRTWCVVWIA